MDKIAQGIQKSLLDRRLAVLIAIGLVAVAVLVRFSRFISHDVGWMLASANQYLDGGGRLYRDIFFEVNPPLALFLKFPAVLFARAAGLFEVNVFLVYVFLLAAGSILVTAKLLSAERQIDGRTRRLLLFAVLLSLLFLQGPEFGQREHFLLVFVLPYLVLVALRVVGRSAEPWLAALCGVMAALGFVLKPHFLLVPMAVELYAMLRARSLWSVLRVETVAMTVTGVGYAVFVAVFTPDYLTSVLPLVIEFYNGAVRNPLQAVLFRLESFLVPLAVVVHLLYRRHQPHPAFGDVFAIASVCFYAVYLIQMKGWHYHALPCLAMSICTLAVVLAGLLESRAESGSDAGSDRSKATIAVALCGLVLFVGATKVQRHGTLSFFAQWMLPVIEEHAPSGTLYALTSNVWQGFPAVNYSESKWGSRYSMQWLLPGVLKRQAEAETLDPQTRERLSEIEAFLRDSIIEDFLRNRPDLVVLDDRETKSYFGDLEFDYVRFLSSDPRFRTLWSGYQQVDNLGPFLIYRRSGPGTAVSRRGGDQAPAPEE